MLDQRLDQRLNRIAVHVQIDCGSVVIGRAQFRLFVARKFRVYPQELARRFPKVRVATTPLWVRDGNIFTSEGISAGIDLALAWVEEDCGVALAHEVARELVLFLRRPSGQNQHSVSLSSQASEMSAISELQIWIAENLQQKLSVQLLADRVAMSVRNFERVFTRELGRTPAHYISQVRVEAAQRQLERTDHPMKRVAAECGFAGVDALRRSFTRFVGVTPKQYRSKVRFSSASE